MSEISHVSRENTCYSSRLFQLRPQNMSFSCAFITMFSQKPFLSMLLSPKQRAHFNGLPRVANIPNSIKVALAIGHWQLGVGHLGIRTQCNVLLE